MATIFTTALRNSSGDKVIADVWGLDGYYLQQETDVRV